MGNWDYLPWDNDSAADWFGDLFDKTKLAKEVEATLNLRAEEGHHEEIRAAASVVILLGHTFVWPIADLDRHLGLAADQLERISKLEIIAESPAMVSMIQQEIEELRSRIDKKDAEPKIPNEPQKVWWKFWN